MLKFNIL